MLYHFHKNITGTINFRKNDILFPFILITVMLVIMFKLLLIQKSDLPFLFVFAWKQFVVLCFIRIEVQNLNPFQKLNLHHDWFRRKFGLFKDSHVDINNFFSWVLCEVPHIFAQVRFLEKCVPILWANCSACLYFFSWTTN